jgi:hypothetical protein
MSYGDLAGRPIVGEFNGGHISSEGGLLLIRRLDEHLGLSKKIAACFTDRRDSSRIEHRIEEQIGQRLYGLVQGYEDLNDHEALRHDLMMGIAVGKLQRRRGDGAALAGKSTLNRLEKSHRRDDSIAANPRYVKTEVNPEQLEQVFLEVFFTQHPRVPKELILDLDVTDNPTYGQQECAEFNGYYQRTCYTPLYLFCGRHLLAARLRPANVDPAAGALEEIPRIVGALQKRWPGVKILVRGDSAYSRDEIMSWCEATPKVDYVFAHSSNRRLTQASEPWQRLTQLHYAQSREHLRKCLAPEVDQLSLTKAELDELTPEAVHYGCFSYQTLNSWSHPRRMVSKVTWGANGVRHHFVVTSISAQGISSKRLHRDFYCPRGEMENRLKEQQLDLLSDRTSNHYFDDNQLRLWLSSFAYVLLNACRQTLLQDTELENARVGTIRTQLLKVGTLIRVSVRRIHLAMHSAFPRQDLFFLAFQRLMALGNTT